MGSEKNKKKVDSSTPYSVRNLRSRTKPGESRNISGQEASDCSKREIVHRKDYSRENKTKSVPLTHSLPNYTTINFNRTLGPVNSCIMSKFKKSVVMNQLKRFQMDLRLTTFDRRVTSITWHPKYPQISVAACKGGDIVLNSFSKPEPMKYCGFGAGASVLGLKCSDRDPYTVYTASMLGQINSIDLNLQQSKILYSCGSTWDNWFTSLDICYNRQLLLFGDCSGKLYLKTTSGDCVWEEKKVHKSKVTHCEFNAKDPNIFVTASVDHTVKLWDLRSMSSSKLKPLMEFPHLKAVNSAFFSPSNRHNLLTTDQHSELRVYSSPCWNESLVIQHPHRQFQHLTPIKAQWHPVEDIIIVGRYPDNNVLIGDIRTIDFYDGSSGDLLHQIYSPSRNIVSLTAMNSTGDILALAVGLYVIYLKDGDGFDPESAGKININYKRNSKQNN